MGNKRKKDLNNHKNNKINISMYRMKNFRIKIRWDNLDTSKMLIKILCNNQTNNNLVWACLFRIFKCPLGLYKIIVIIITLTLTDTCLTQMDKK